MLVKLSKGNNSPPLFLLTWYGQSNVSVHSPIASQPTVQCGDTYIVACRSIGEGAYSQLPRRRYEVQLSVLQRKKALPIFVPLSRDVQENTTGAQEKLGAAGPHRYLCECHDQNYIMNGFTICHTPVG